MEQKICKSLKGKKVWSKPKLVNYGSVEKITLKGFGANDGHGLQPAGSHPSL